MQTLNGISVVHSVHTLGISTFMHCAAVNTKTNEQFLFNSTNNSSNKTIHSFAIFTRER